MYVYRVVERLSHLGDVEVRHGYKEVAINVCRFIGSHELDLHDGSAITWASSTGMTKASVCVSVEEGKTYEL